MRIDVSLLRVLEGLSEYDILKVMAGLYLQNEYGVDFEDDDLETTEEYVETDNDLLINIQNTFANIDRDYSDEDNDEDDYEDEDYENDDYDDYDEEDNDDDYWNSYDEDEVDDDTQRLIEENRKKNEIALGL